MIILVIILTIIILCCFFIIYNLYSQLEQLETIVKTTIEREDEFEYYYNLILERLIHTNEQINKVDKNGAFASDDEVGFVFKIIQRSIDELVNRIKSLRVN